MPIASASISYYCRSRQPFLLCAYIQWPLATFQRITHNITKAQNSTVMKYRVISVLLNTVFKHFYISCCKYNSIFLILFVVSYVCLVYLNSLNDFITTVYTIVNGVHANYSLGYKWLKFFLTQCYWSTYILLWYERFFPLKYKLGFAQVDLDY